MIENLNFETPVMDNIEQQNPQNPYTSCIVGASAGSGKTYQLSRRFLYLVSAGSSPSSILTITFTKKAAQEMRARIIGEASQLLKDKKRRQEFEGDMKCFYDGFMSGKTEHCVAPLSAQMTAKKILSQTQSLRVSTIDALFNEWVNRFSFEAGEGTYPSPYTLMSEDENREIESQSWSKLFNLASESKLENDSDIVGIMRIVLDILQDYDNELKVSSLHSILEDLLKNDSIIWSSDQQGSALFHFPVAKTEYGDFSECLAAIKGNLSNILNQCAHPEKYEKILQADSLKSIISHKLITKNLEISKSIIKSKKRELLSSDIEKVESALKLESNKLSCNILNISSQAIMNIYKIWTMIKDKLKNEKNRLDFSDVAKGAYRLVSDIKNQGISWLIQKNTNHIMLDEFQDTSLLQWGIFKNLSAELISSRDEELGNPRTVFIVGDIKQSIYGFRQADPSVMASAKDFLNAANFPEIPLNKSYRTSQLVLNYINTVFKKLIGPTFPEHSTAQLGRVPFIPNHSKVMIFDTFEEKDTASDTVKSVDHEADQIARFIKTVLDNPDSYPVYDKGQFRPIRADDIVILYKNKTKSEIFEQALRDHQLHPSKEEKSGFFERQEIEDLICIVKFLTYPSDSLSLFTILKSPIFAVNDADIFKLNRIITEQSIKKIDLLQIVLDYFISNKNPECSHSLKLFKTIAVNKAFRSFSDLVAKLIFELQVPHKYKYAFGEREGELAEANISKFLMMLDMISSDGLKTDVQMLDHLQKLKSLNNEGSAASSHSAIKMMTIHKSKGLEFAMVFIVETAQKWFKKNTYWESFKTESNETKMAFLGFGKQKTLVNDTLDEVESKIEKKLFDESIRVLYVAMTRASQYLILSGNVKDAEKYMEKSDTHTFFQTLYKCSKEMGAKLNSNGAYEISNKEIDIEISVPEISTGDRARELINDQKNLSPDCELISPHSLVEKENRGVSTIKKTSSPPARYSSDLGSFFHKLLEEAVKTKSFPCEDKTALITRMFFADPHASELKPWIDLYVSDAEKCLKTIYEIAEGSDAKYLTEVNIVNRVENRLIKGVLDLLIITEKAVYIIDHKTTGPLEAQDAKNFCIEQGYHRQLGTYKDAVMKIYPQKIVISAVLLSRINTLVTLEGTLP